MFLKSDIDLRAKRQSGLRSTQSPDEPLGAGGLKPTLEDKDAGLVGIAPGFDLGSYRMVLVDRVSVTVLTCWQQAVQENPHTAASIVSLIHMIIQEQERSRDFKQCLERQGYQRGKPS